MGKRHQGGRLHVCNLPETNSVEEFKLDAYTRHAEAPEIVSAWGIDSTQQCIDEKTGRYIQFISDRSCRPLIIYQGDREKPPVGLTSQIVGNSVANVASQTEDEEMVYINDSKKKDSRLLWIGICLALLTLILLLVVYLRMT